MTGADSRAVQLLGLGRVPSAREGGAGILPKQARRHRVSCRETSYGQAESFSVLFSCLLSCSFFFFSFKLEEIEKKDRSRCDHNLVLIQDLGFDMRIPRVIFSNVSIAFIPMM